MDSNEVGEAQAAAVAVAPRVTLESIEAKIVHEDYVVFGLTTTVCALRTDTGFTVIGKSGCASPENFNIELGRKFAREDAIRQLWGYEGYALKERLSRDG